MVVKASTRRTAGAVPSGTTRSASCPGSARQRWERGSTAPGYFDDVNLHVLFLDSPTTTPREPRWRALQDVNLFRQWTAMSFAARCGITG